MGSQTKHLTEEQITWAIIDENELPQMAKDHLVRCQMCSRKVESLTSSLGKIGKLAAESVPVPPPRPVFERKKSKQRSIVFSWGHLGLSAALAGLLVVVVFGGFQINQYRLHKRIAAVTREMEMDMSLMAEVDDLIENPLPQIYEEISGEDISGVGADFMDFLIPDVAPERNEQPSHKMGLV